MCALKRKRAFLFTTALGTSLAASVFTPDRAAAQVSTNFTVSGDVTAPQTFNFATLSALPSITETDMFLSGTTPTTATFAGPSIWNLLNTTVGIRTNSAVKNDTLRQVILATGSDGYQVLYSMGELNPSFGGSSAIPPLVADLENGVPLTTDGFARTTAPLDVKGGRYDSNLTSLYVIHAPTQTATFSGGTTTQFTVTGNVTTPATYNMATLSALPSTTITVGGNSYAGVNLWTLLSASNVVTNPTIKNNILTDYVVATGSDGYQAVISLGEIDPSFGNQPDLIAYYLNGGSLGANGFARLVVPNDVKQGRWVSNLINLELFDSTIWTANAGEIADLTGLNINANGVVLNGGTLTSSIGPGTLTVPTVTLNGGLLDTPVTVNSPNTITQSSGVSLIAGTLAAPTIAINGGMLQLLGGTLTGATNVASGAAFGGTGSINGALTFASGSTFAAAVTPAASTLVNVTGTAALAGTLQLSGSGAAGSTYKLLGTTGGLTGKFTTVSTAAFASWLIPTLNYTGTEVDLSLSQKTIGSQLSIPVSQNARSAAFATDAVLLSGRAPQSFLNLFNLSPSALPAALQQISGEAATGGETVGLQAGSSFLNLLLDPASRSNTAGAVASTPALAYAPAPALSGGGKAIAQALRNDDKPASIRLGWSLWGTAFGGFSGTNGDSTTGSSRITNNAEGLAVGADFRPDASFVTGFGLAGGGTSYQLSNGLGSGSGGLFQAGAFASKSLGAFYISAATAYTLNPMQVTRSLPVTGSFAVLRSDPVGQAGGARAEIGYHSERWLGLPITPYVAGEAQHFGTNGVNEYATQGISDFALSYAPLGASSVRSEIGLRSETSVTISPGLLLPTDALFVASGRLAWAHEYDRSRTATALFESVAVTPFSVTGAAPAANVALVTAGSELRLTNGFTLFTKADAELASNTYIVRGNVGLNYTW
jgi:uncharacterized protein with beta-barrel porin domain